MKKAMVFAAAFTAGSALAQVGSWSGGATSDIGAGSRFGAGPQIPADTRASGRAAAAARPPRSGAGAGTAGAVSANPVGVSGSSGAPQASGSTSITSGTAWGAAPSGVTLDGGQANNAAKRESEDGRDPVEDKAERQIDKP